MKIVETFDKNGKTLNQILEEYIIVTMQSIIDSKLLYKFIIPDNTNKEINE